MLTNHDPETPIEPGQRELLKAPVAAARVLTPLMQQFSDAAQSAARGEVARIGPDAPPPDLHIVQAGYQPPYVPRKHRRASLDGFDPAIAGAPYVGELTGAVRAVRQWVRGAKQGAEAGGSMLALVGSQGSGKSHLLYGAVNLLALNGVRIFSRPWYRLADELRYGGPSPFAPDGPSQESQELRRLLYRARVVVIDEVRATAGTAFDDTELAKFACHAWDEGVAVLITSNVAPLAKVMGEAAADRFTCVTLTAPSRRQA